MDVKSEVLINCPRDEVAGFAMDSSNDTRWIGGVTEVKELTESPFGKGSQVQRVASFLGRRIEYVNEVTEYDPAGLLVMRSIKGPFPMTIRYEFQEAPQATVARIQVQGEAGGFFKLASPLLAQAVKRNVTKDLNTLKRLLESDAGKAR